MTLAELLCARFRGRPDVLAVGSPKGFAPHPCADGIDPTWIERQHLAGKQCLGFYLMTQDNCVYVTALDFDNKPERPNPAWKIQAEQVYFELVRADIVPLVEVSQSGTAAHVWLFFESAVPAWLPREWWLALGRKLGLTFPEIYPRQNKLMGKGLGNLIRYPLWKESRFVDAENEWATIQPLDALANIRTIDGDGLRLLAWNLGLGELKEPAVLSAGDDAGALSVRIRRLLEHRHTTLARRWSGDTAGMKDSSKSAVAMSIAVEMVRAYVPTPEVEAALRHWCAENGAQAKGEREDWLNRTVSKAYDFVVTKTEQKSIESTTFEAACHAYLDRLDAGAETHLGSGVVMLDASIDGVAPGEVCVIAARPGHGKSAFAFQWLDAVAGNGSACLIISEEMGAIEIGKRRLLSISAMPPEHWTADCVPLLREDVKNYHAGRAPVYIVENCNSIDRAEEVIDQFCGIHGVKMVAVDYLQLLTSRQSGRYEIVTEISRRLKQTARRNNCAMLALSQLNREIEKRGGDRRPTLADLRESGQVEQDADLVIFVQWPRLFSDKSPPDDYRIYVAKRRNGPIRQNQIKTRFDPSRQLIGGAPAETVAFAGQEDER